MIVDWNPHVNQELSFDGDHGLSDGFIETLQFESGKERIYLKNSYVPTEYPSLSLMLNNIVPTDSGKTEYKEFENWYNVSTRYGLLPFYFPRIGYIKDWHIKTGEMGIYQFLPNSLRYDRIDGIIMATFGIKEIGYLSEIEEVFLTSENGKILLTGNGKHIVIREE